MSLHSLETARDCAIKMADRWRHACAIVASRRGAPSWDILQLRAGVLTDVPKGWQLVDVIYPKEEG